MFSEIVYQVESWIPRQMMNANVLWQGRVKQKLSSGGKYVSVNIGPVQVISSEQVFPSLPHTSHREFAVNFICV